jgi:hypothetical protein
MRRIALSRLVVQGLLAEDETAEMAYDRLSPCG